MRYLEKKFNVLVNGFNKREECPKCGNNLRIKIIYLKSKKEIQKFCFYCGYKEIKNELE